MIRETTIFALVGFILGMRHMLMFFAGRHQRTEVGEALDTWEAEGGAVPVAPNRTAAQTAP